MKVVLDACAIIAFLRDEPGADVVERHLVDPSDECFAHSVNVCEVLYDGIRVGGESTARAALNSLRRLGVKVRRDIGADFCWRVSRHKAVLRKVSLADCFAITLSNELGATILTSDHHEFDALARQGICRVTFIR